MTGSDFGRSNSGFSAKGTSRGGQNAFIVGISRTFMIPLPTVAGPTIILVIITNSA